MAKQARRSTRAAVPARQPTRQPVQVVDKRHAQQVVDSLQNLISGIGTEKDKSTGVSWVFTQINQAQAESAYRGDWIARKIIDIPAGDATREWRAWQADKADITQIEKAEASLKLQQKTKRALWKSRLYGGAAMIIGVEGNQEEELVIENVQKGQLKWVHVVAQHELQARELELDIESPFFGEPKFYERTGASKTVRFHPSRVVRFIGAEIPDINQTVSTWGDSVLQIVQDAVQAAGIVSNSLAQLIQEAKLDVISIPDLTENISNKEYETRLKNRFGLANVAKSIYSMLILDKEEQWQRVEATFTGMPDVLKTYLLIASGAADIPATRMLGQSPAGLSATGDSDIRNYYDRIKVEQNTIMRPAMERLDEVLIRSSLGDRPEELFYEWRSLWQMDDAQKAEVSSKKAQTFKVDVDSGLFPNEVMRQARLNQLIEDGTYPGLEQIVEDFGDLEEGMIEEQEPPANENDPNAPPIEEPPVDEPAAVTAADGVAKRARRTRKVRMGNRWADATPRTLYVRRDVLNADAIIAWAKEQGFTSTVPAKQLHVTVCFSRTPVDWIKVASYEPWGQDEKGQLRIAPGGPRVMEKFKGDAIVLVFVSSNLTYRHCQIKEAGASWDYPDYQPHITITYEGAPPDLSKVVPYRGEIILGPEIFEEVNEDYRETITEQ